MVLDTIVGPACGALMHATGRFPSGAVLDVRVLVLGDDHTAGQHQHQQQHPNRHHHQADAGSTVHDLLERAAEAAESNSQCVDVYIETPAVDRANVYPVPGTIARLNEWLLPCLSSGSRRAPGQRGARCPLDPRRVRVHAFDSRATQADADLNRTIKQRGDSRDPFGKDGWPPGAHVAYFGFLTGLGREPSSFGPALVRFLGNSVVLAQRWLDVHAVLSRRVRRRARLMPPGDVQHLLRASYESLTSSSRSTTWGVMLAAAADVYLMLRMLAPYDSRPQRPADACGAPRHCVVYAGVWHAANILRTLGVLAHGDAGAAPTADMRMTAPDRVRLVDIPIVSADLQVWVCDSLGDLVDQLLASDAQSQRRDPFRLGFRTTRVHHTTLARMTQ